MSGLAVISPCGLYRYRLDRSVGMAGPVYAFFGVNPSTADASEDDATVRKWIGFTKLWGGSRFIVGNVFAYRATDVADLGRAVDPIGPDNWISLERIIAEADVLVPCWGRRTKAPKRHAGELEVLMLRLLESGKPVMQFGATACGQPKHPLMLAYETQLTPCGAT